MSCTGRDLHGVFLEKFLELLLGCRIGEVSNVQPTALVRTGSCSVSSLGGCRGAVGVRRVVDGGLSHVVRKRVDGRHFDELTQRGSDRKSFGVKQTRGEAVC